MVETELSVGSHTVRVEKTGYKPVEFTLNVSATSVTCSDGDVCDNQVSIDFDSSKGVWKVTVDLYKGFRSFADWLNAKPSIGPDEVREIIRAWINMIRFGFTVTKEHVRTTIRKWLGLG